MATGFPIIFGKSQYWTPAQVQTALWLDSADFNTLVLNGSTVTSWVDKSGNGRTATQTTTANQPTYNRTGYNNKPALSFDGTNDLLNMTDGSMPTGDSNYSVFAVIKFNAVANNIVIGRAPGAGTGTACYLGVISTNTMGNWWSGTGVSLGTVSASDQALYSSVYNNTTSTITAVKNGTVLENFVAPIDRVSLGTQQSIGGNPIANDLYMNALLAETIIMHSTASTVDRQLIEGYLAWKWGGF